MSDSSFDPLEPDLLQSNRLQILSPEEYEALWGLPRFTPAERDIFFSVTARERDAMDKLRTTRTKLHFLLQLGYFRARQCVFRFDLADVRDDVSYLRQRYLENRPVPNIEVSDHTRKHHIDLILQLFGYSLCGREERAALEAHAIHVARISTRPAYLLRELIDHLRQHRIVLPGYSFLQDVVSRALAFERRRMAEVLGELIDKNQAFMLDRLLSDHDGLYAITTIRHEPRDFSHKQLLAEISRGEQIRPLVELATLSTQQAELSTESIRYYASLVDYYTVYKLKRLARETVQLYLLCFVLDRYQRLNDNLVTAFCTLVAQYADEAAEMAKEAVYQHKLQLNEDMERGAQILMLFLDPSIDGRSRFATVRERAHQLLDAERLERLSRHLAGEAVFDETAYEWEAIDVIMRKAKRNLRPLLRFLDLQGTPAQAEFLNGVNIMKDAFSTGSPLSQSHLSPSIIPARLRRYLINSDGTLIRNRYEFMVYRFLRDRLQAGDIFCNDSVSFRKLDDDLVDDHTFQQRQVIFTQHGLEAANRPIQEQLEELGTRLNERFDTVNRQILDGKNAYVRLQDGRLDWKRAVRSQEPLPHEPFFDGLERIDIDTLLLAVDRRCDFMAAFEHVLGRYQKTPLSKPALVATLMAYATDIGLGRMAEISNLTYQELSTTANNFVRLETLHEANKLLGNATAKLPIFRHFDIDEVVHSSSDGQKFEVDIPSFNARYSPKYFGLKKGVVAYTLLGNHVPLNARIIGANEHESHYVFDILYSNSTDIIPSIHSTDTHGTNEVNFALLHLFGYQFAPRYRDFKQRVATGLYSMRHPNHYRGQPLRPVRKLSERLIVSEWPNVEHILLSLLLKSTTQSIIISKLSAYQRTNRTKRALWEFDNLIKSLYLLDYIGSPGLRKNVQRAVNRGEEYHQLRRAIAYAHGGRFRVRSQHEQEIWNECARLVANTVVYYNSLILSEVLDDLEKHGEMIAVETLKRVSSIAWQHINFYGRYHFDADFSPIDLAAIRQHLSSEEVLRFYTA